MAQLHGLSSHLENFNWVSNAQTVSGPTPKQPPVFEDFLSGTRALQILQDRGQLVFSIEEIQEVQGGTLPLGSVGGHDMVEAAKHGYEYRRDTADTGRILYKKTPRPVLLVKRENNRGNTIVIQDSCLFGIRIDRDIVARVFTEGG